MVLLSFRAWSVISLLWLFLFLLLHFLVVFVVVVIELMRFGALIIQSLKCWELASSNETWCNLTHLSRFDRWSMLNEGINDLIYNLRKKGQFINNFDRWSMLNEHIYSLIYNLQNIFYQYLLRSSSAFQIENTEYWTILTAVWKGVKPLCYKSENNLEIAQLW